MQVPSAGNAPFTQRNTRAAKLTASAVLEIRDFYEKGRISQGQLARDYGVSVVQIGRIVRGEVWQGLRNAMPSNEAIEESAQRMLKLQEEVNNKLEPVAAQPPSPVMPASTNSLAAQAIALGAVNIRSPLDE